MVERFAYSVKFFPVAKREETASFVVSHIPDFL
jgi:hypothetical protein